MPNRFSAPIVAISIGAAILSAAPDASAREQLVIGQTQFPATFHPSIDSMMAKSYVLAMARRPFTTYDADWNLVCLLCTELPSIEAGTAVVEERPDGTKGIAVTYTIQEDATWGDGVPITTDDVVFAWEVGRQPASGYSNFELYSSKITDITVKDEKTFTLHRDRLVCDYQEINDFEVLPAHLERPIFEASPAEYKDRTLYQTDTTNPGLWFGPYRIAQVETGSHVVLERNPTWWGPEPEFDRVVVRAIENTAALEAGLLAGQIDYIPGELGLPLDQALALQRRQGDRFNFFYQPGLVYEHIDVNHDNPIVADVRVRRALLHAVDREAISRQLFQGEQPVAHNMINPLDKVFSPDFAHYSYDPEEAKRLLDEAGWSEIRNGVRYNAAGDRLSLQIITTAGNRTRELVQQALQAQWKAVGIEVRIENQPPRVLFGQTLTERRFDSLAMFAWLSSPNNIPRTILHSTMIPSEANGWAGENYLGYNDPEMDRILDDLEVVCEPEANKALWTRLQQLYAEDLPALPLYYRADPFVIPTWLEGMRPTGHQHSSTLWIEEWRTTP